MPVTGFTKPSRPFLLGIAGGSGSGKTTLAEAIRSFVGSGNCEILYQDNFYIDQSQRFDFDGGTINFDHPDSLDFTQLGRCLEALRSGVDVEIPIYDFHSHRVRADRLRVSPKALVIVDGILIFHSALVRQMFDEKIFCHSEEAIRFARRLRRDVDERGRSAEGVRQQFERQVKPMHDLYVEPSRSFADIIVDDASNLTSIVHRYDRFRS